MTDIAKTLYDKLQKMNLSPMERFLIAIILKESVANDLNEIVYDSCYVRREECDEINNKNAEDTDDDTDDEEPDEIDRKHAKKIIDEENENPLVG